MSGVLYVDRFLSDEKAHDFVLDSSSISSGL